MTAATGQPGLIELIRARADVAPHDPAVGSSPGAAWTYAELTTRIDSVAEGLTRRGFKPGHRMLFSIRPSPESIALVLGTIAAGGTIVFLDPGMSEELFRSRISLIDPKWVAAESLLYAAAAPGPLGMLARRRGLVLPRLSSLRAHKIRCGPWLPGVPRGSVEARALLDQRITGPGLDSRSLDSEALVVFTSGTTADPKAVVHSERSLTAAFHALAGRAELEPGSVVYTDQAMIGLPALLSGARWNIPRHPLMSGIDERRFMQFLGDATHAFVVPAHLPKMMSLIAAGEVEFPGSLEQILLGGAPVNAAALKAVRSVLPDVDVMAIYGMTEILPIATVSAEDKLAYEGAGDLVGTPVPGIEVRVADDDELHFSGPNLCTGYLGAGPMSEHASGDLGSLVEGRIVLSGRSKDMFIRGDTNVYPGLYEPRITSLPGVDGCAFVSVPDRYGDEQIILALVTASADAFDRAVDALESIVDHAARPDRVLRVDCIPTSGRASKPDRALLAAQLEKVNRS